MDYKEKLEEAKRLYETATADQKYVLESLFPEIRESEDELAWLKKYIEEEAYSLSMDIRDNEDRIKLKNLRKALAWLEKQGERKEIDYNEELKKCRANPLYFFDKYVKVKPNERKPADKVEPKFHEGEWITNGDYTWKIVEVKSLDYILQSQDGNIVDDTISHVDEQFHSFTIQDAKDGDVLCCESGWTCIFKTLNSDNISFSSYCFMDNTGWFCETGSEGHTLEKAFIRAYNGNIYPATKEQRANLMNAMADAGYTFDFEKKELKKISQRMISAEAKEAMYNKPADTVELKCEESKTKIFDAPTPFEDKLYAFVAACEFLAIPSKIEFILEHSQEILDAAREQIGKEQSSTWSEEDEKEYKYVLKFVDNILNNCGNKKDYEHCKRCYDWLKSLKTKVQPKQEWSEKDEEELEIAIDTLKESGRYDSAKWVQSLKQRIGG